MSPRLGRLGVYASHDRYLAAEPSDAPGRSLVIVHRILSFGAHQPSWLRGEDRSGVARNEERLSAGTLSVISECAAGVQPASPTPTPTRASSSCGKVRAAPHAMVIADQIATDQAISETRLVVLRSA